MYDAIADPYCYPGTTVLENIPDIRDQNELDAFEMLSTLERAEIASFGGDEAPLVATLDRML